MNGETRLGPSGSVWLMLTLAGSIALEASPLRAAAAPNWDDVAPVLERNCVRCHRGGGVAPMRLDAYAAARPWARSIARAVSSRAMPPWFADPEVGEWSNDPRLTAGEVDQIVAWARGGAAGPGAREEAPPAPASSPEAASWRIGEPDLLIESPQPFAVPADGVVDYVYVRLPEPFAESRWLQAIEARPSKGEVVHHIDVFTCAAWCREDLEPGVPTIFDDPEEGSEGGADESGGAGEGEEIGAGDGTAAQRDTGDVFALGDEQLLFSYLPGGDPWVFPEGAAREIPAGTELMLNIHYTPNGVAVDDRVQVAMRFAEAPPATRMLTFGVDNYSLVLPAGAESHRVNAEMITGLPLRLTALTPHMHFRGGAFEFQVAPPGQPDAWRTVLRLPRYDFNWQLTYRFAEPLDLPVGSHLRAVGWYDNSAENPFNPDPEDDIFWGRQSTDEMMSAWIEVALPGELAAEELERLAEPADR